VKKRIKKLSLNRETLMNLSYVMGLNTNSGLSAQVSLCYAVTETTDCRPTPAKPLCPAPIE
jgi:hypothetical protein